MKVHADQDACIGSGLCVLRLPAMFDQCEEDGSVVVLRAGPDPGQEVTLIQAVAACPSGALRVDR